MKAIRLNQVRRSVLLLCLLLPLHRVAAQFVELSAEIENFGYRLEDTNSIAKAKPRTVHVVCIASSNVSYIENDIQFSNQPTCSGGIFRQSLSSSKPDAVTNKTVIGSAPASAELNPSVHRPRLRL